MVSLVPSQSPAPYLERRNSSRRTSIAVSKAALASSSTDWTPPQHYRRASLRRASTASLSLMNPRVPLAPLGPQMTPAYAYADAQSLPSDAPLLKPYRASYSDESLAQDSPHAAATLYPRLISTPSRMRADSRRTSLPTLHLTSAHAAPPGPSTSTSHIFPPLQPPKDSRLFEQLSSYVLTSNVPNRTLSSFIHDDDIAPTTPSSNIPFLNSRPPPLRGNENAKIDRDGSESPDEDELVRRLDRAKLRAIDDGARRPSLPINISPSNQTTPRASRDPAFLAHAQAAKALPDLPDLPASDPGPSAFNSFNFDFLLGDGPLTMAPIPTSTMAGPSRRLSVSLDSASPAPWEDTFAQFVDQHDHEYSERRAQWSFRRRPPMSIGNSAPGVYECGAMGSYWVGAGAVEAGPSKGSLLKNSPSSSKFPKASPLAESSTPRHTALVIRRFPESSPATSPKSPMTPMSPRSQQQPPSSAVRIYIHKHSKAPAFSLFLGSWNPGTAARTSILLGTKKVHMHVSSKKKDGAAAARSASRPTSSSGVGAFSDASANASRTRGTSTLGPVTSMSKPLRQTVVSPPPSSPPSPGGIIDDAMEEDDADPGDMFNDIIRLPLPQRPPRPGYVPHFVNPLRESREENEMEVDRHSPNHPHATTSNHAAAFATLGPEVHSLLLDQARSRYTFGGRIKRVLGAGSSPSPPSSLASSPYTSHPVPMDLGTYQPPWMLMAPGYLKEESLKKTKRLQASFEGVGLLPAAKERSSSKRGASANSSKSSRHGYSSSTASRDSSGTVTSPTSITTVSSVASSSSGTSRRSTVSFSHLAKEASQTITPLPSRNDVLEPIGGETMCMAVPLWDFRADLAAETSSSYDSLSSPLSSSSSSTSSSSTVSPLSRQWLFVTYVPFSEGAGNAASTSSGSTRSSKKRPRRSSNARISSISSPLSPISRDTSISSSSSGGVSTNLRSFRVVGRILSATELHYSGLRHPSTNSTPAFSTPHASAIAPPSNSDPFSAVLAICHDARLGSVEYIPEGLDRLGLCGRPPRHVVGAVNPFGAGVGDEDEGLGRDFVESLSEVGREVVEITWAGCLALMDSGL